MPAPPSVLIANDWLAWSNAAYVLGAVLTFASALYILHENREIASGKREKYALVSELAVAASALISLLGTIGAIHFSSVVSRLKDAEVATYEKQADAQTSQNRASAARANLSAQIANQQAQTANQRAQTAYQKASEARLREESVAAQEAETQKRTTVLAAQTARTDQFAQGLAVQQQGMAQQMQSAASLSDAQIRLIADLLKPYSGSKVSLHTLMDVRSQRLAEQFAQVMKSAGINVVDFSTDIGLNYSGINVLIKKVDGHPPLADALVQALGSVSLKAKPSLLPSLADDVVGVYIGPE